MQTPQAQLAATVNASLKAELGRHDVTPAQLRDWTGLSADTIRSRRAGKTDWTLRELAVLAERLNLDIEVRIASREVSRKSYAGG